MTNINTYSPEQVQEKTHELVQEILESGWDDVAMYRYEITALSEAEFLEKILSQPRVIPPSEHVASQYPTSQPVVSTGNGVSFGGWVSVDYPYLTRFMGYDQYAPDNTQLEMDAAELLGILLQEGDAPKAEELARRKYLNYPDGVVKKVRRGFIFVIVPVKYGS